MVLIIVLCLGVMSVSASKHFCADMKPQNSVDIEQLMGMWFGIEIISHKPDEIRIDEYYDSCPVIYLSEIQQPTTVAAYGYGSEYGYGGEDYGKTYTTRFKSDMTTTVKPTPMYETYGRGVYNNEDFYNNRRHMKRDELRKLRLLWDESGLNVEYTLKFNSTRAGFWMSSGPQNGSMLAKQYNQFAGTIQVMKAVGNHLVLTFCHQLPDRDLFSLLLAREPRLDHMEILGVHNLLSRRELTIGKIRKVCTNGSTTINNVYFLVTLASTLVCLKNLSLTSSR